MNNTHLSYISLLRVVAMVTVVLHHTLCFYGAWFPYDDSQTCLNFTLALKEISMPMFIALAGFIYSYLKVNHGKYNNTGTFVLGKAKRLLLPYLLWSAVLLTPLNLAEAKPINVLYGTWHLWFLLVLFLEFMFFHFTFRFWSKTSKVADCAIFAMLFVASHLIIKFVNSHGIDIRCFCLYLFIRYIPFCYLGMVLGKSRFNIKSVVIPAIAVLAGSAAVVVIWLFCGDAKGAATINHLLTAMVIIAAIPVADSFCKRFPSIASSKIIADLDKSSMGIYILHHILILDFVSLPVGAGFMNEHVILAPAVVFVVSLLLSWAITHAILRTRLRFVFG